MWRGCERLMMDEWGHGGHQITVVGAGIVVQVRMQTTECHRSWRPSCSRFGLKNEMGPILKLGLKYKYGNLRSILLNH
jgi:hypothetical protein